MRSFKEKIFLAGSGGQGVLFLGKALYLTAVGKGFQAAYFPSYGAEVRGGTTKCMVTVSRDRIASPIFQRPDSAIILNDLSLKKYKDLLKSCRDIILFQKERQKVRPFVQGQNIYTFSCSAIPSFENVRSAALYSRVAGWFSKDDFLSALEHILRFKKPDLIAKNKEVFEETYKENEKLKQKCASHR